MEYTDGIQWVPVGLDDQTPNPATSRGDSVPDGQVPPLEMVGRLRFTTKSGVKIRLTIIGPDAEARTYADRVMAVLDADAEPIS